MMEWVIGEIPNTIESTEEAEKNIILAYVSIRRCVRKLVFWKGAFIISVLSLISIWFSSMQLPAINRIPITTEPLNWEHIQKIVDNGGALLIENPEITAHEISNENYYTSYYSSAFMEGSLPDGKKFVIIKRDLGKFNPSPESIILIHRPKISMRSLIYFINPNYPNAVVCVANKKDISNYIKSFRYNNIVFLFAFFGFMVYSLFAVLRLRRWLRVARLKNGTHEFSELSI